MNRTRAAVVLLLVTLAGPVSARADTVLRWNELLIGTVPAANPFVASRVAATMHLAVFEAVNAITGGYEPYLGTIAALPGASADAAAAAAAHAVLVHFFPAPATVAVLDAALAESLSAIADGAPKTNGIATGVAAAAAMIALRAQDGSSPPQFFLPSSTDPGAWQVTPACTAAGGVAWQWGAVTPFGLESGDQYRVPKPPRLTSERFRRAYDELADVGGVNSTSRPPDRADVARFYNALFPAPLWNSVARQLAELDGGSLAAHARAFALLNMSMADGLIAVWDSKYTYTFWRPETAIRAGATDGNRKTDADPDFAPYIATPCHPSYPSGHAGVSNSALGIIAAIWGDAGHSIQLDYAPVPDVVLHYTKLSDITADIDDARVYGGIHFRFDQEEGVVQGLKIAKYIYKRYLQPRD